MTTTTSARTGRRFQLRPSRLLLATAVLALVLAAAWAVPNRLTLLLRVPAANPLGVEAGGGFNPVAAAPYPGRCVALRVFPSGETYAATLDGTDLVVHVLRADGSSASTRCQVQGDVGQAAFTGTGFLLAWASDRGTGAGTIYGFGPLQAGIFGSQPIGAAWTLRTPGPGAALLPLAGGNAAAVGSAAGGTPLHCTVLSGAGQLVASWQLGDGLYSAWDCGGPAGSFGLAGALYDQQSGAMTTFVRTYTPAGRQETSAITPGGAAVRIAVSASGKHVLVASVTRVSVVEADGGAGWSRSLPGENVRSLHVFPDGRSLVTGPDNGLVLDDSGAVVARWQTTGQGAVASPAPSEYALLSLPGGCAAIDSSGRVVAKVLWEGQSQLVAGDATLQWLARADGATITLYSR